MKKKTLAALAGKLYRRRKYYLKEFKEAEKNLSLLAEDRESEMEESAQEDRTVRLLSRLDDRSVRAVEEIDAALERIKLGTFGKCQSCEKMIPIARLRSLPETCYCAPCAQRLRSPPSSNQAEITRLAEVPGDLLLLSDRELRAAIHEKIKEDGRVDTDELRVVCRNGVVYLYGALPSQSEHQILLGILKDVLGLKEIVDRTRIDKVLWERPERSKREIQAATLPWEEPEATDDVVECVEEGKEFSPPDRPIPEEE